MAVKGKAKQIAEKSAASSSSSSRKRKISHAEAESSKKKSGVSQFIDDASKDADFEAEEEEEDDFEWDMDEDFEFELPDIGAKEVKNVSKGPAKLSPLPFLIKEEDLNDDELEEAIKERYCSSRFDSLDEDVKECDESLSLPRATKYLSFWRVKCMMGRERQIAFCLMQKFVDLLKIGKQLQIFSVFALEHVQGFVFVEAEKACNVFEACNGLCFMYPSRIELVPRNEAPNLFSIQKKACGISKGMWVRMKSGKYKGDLAEVVLVNDAKKRVTIKLVPRIDLQAIAKKFGGGASLKAAAIPAPRLINSHELEEFRPQIEVRRDRETGEIFEVLDGLMLKDGYLYKKVSMGSLIHWGVQPSSDELTKFEDLGKDEAKDISWLSSIYQTKMKKKLPETSNQTNGEKSNQKIGEKSNQKNGEKSNHKDGEKANLMDGDKQRNGFDIDDFVLFGKKDCGIIIDKETDTFKILKGDVNGSEVVTINIRVIKKNCIDKVFRATDRCKKTISIDDVVKVFEGPLEGREGFVRHMYKGVLFIYDECQSENNGFFCAKSEICDLVKKSRDFGGGKLGGNVGHSFAQSPIRSSMEDDNSQSFSRNSQSNSRGTFALGQTLRICKGPLKGYLCRVIRIYRADVTVKLDSLGKLLTVDEKLLSLPNSKRDDATAMQCDMFGSQEGQSTGGGLGIDNVEFNAGMSSFGRDSWSTPSCSNFAFSKDNDGKDQDHGAANSWGKAPSSNAEQSSWNKMESGEKGSDAWNKASSKGETSTGGWQIDTPVQKTGETWSTKDQDHGAANSWGKALSSNAEQSSWNKMESGEKDSDAWNKASTKGETSTGGWQIDTPVQKTGETWSTKGASSGWDNAVHSAVEGVNDAGGWSKAKLSTTDSGEGRTFGTETSGWGQTKLPSSDGNGSWNTQGANADGDKGTSRKDRAEGFGGQMGDWASSKSGGDNQDSCGIKGKGLLGNNDDSWSKPAASKETNPVANNPVETKAWKIPSADENQAECASQTSSWDKVKTAPSHIGCAKSDAGATEIGGWKKSTDGNKAAGWAASAMDSGTSSVEDGSQSNSWNKVKSLPSSSGWEKSKDAVSETVGVRKTTTDSNQSNQAAGWGTAMSSATPVEHETQTSSWDKVIISPSSSQWQISKPADATEKEDCKKDGFSSEGQIDKWNKGNSSDTDQASGWNKAGNSEGGKVISTDSWGKAKSSEGCSFGQESQGQWKAGVDWPNDHHDPNFGKSKDSDSGQGSGWSQGHSNNENGESWGRGNSWSQQRDFDGGRGSSRGSGRGRYGGRGGRNKDSFEKPGDSDGGWSFGSGRGGGRNGSGGYNRDNSDTREFGRGRGRYQSRGRGQDQGQFDSSDWRSGRERFESYSNKPSSSWGITEDSDGGKPRDQQLTGVEEKVSWNSWNSNDAARNKNELNEDHDSGWSKGVSTGKQIDNWSKETTKNENCNTTKTSDDKLSSWNQTSNNTAKDTTSSQSTDWVHGLPESNKGDTLSGKLNSNDWCKTATPNEEDEAAGNQGGWSSKKVGSQASQPSSETANNWDSKKELTSSQENWGGKDSAGNQSSDWSKGGENKWSKQSGSQGDSQSWSHGSDFGRGRGRRDNSFSRGRGGFGRNTGGRHSYGWNSGDDSAKEGNDGGQAFNSNQEFKSGGSWSKGHETSEAGKSSWNSGGNAEKCSGWGASASASVDKVESSLADGPAADGSANWNSSSSAWDSKKEVISSQPNWGQKDNSGSQTSDWGNGDGGNKWSKQNDSQDKSENWSRRSDFGRGGGRSDFGRGGGRSDFGRGGGRSDYGRCGGRSDYGRGGGRSDFGRGGGRSDFGRGGGRGRDSSFSGGGRGLLGRYSGGRSYSKEGNEGWQTSNSNQEVKTGGSWNSGGNAEKSSWGSWKSEGENQPAGGANLGPEPEGGKSSWDTPTGFGSNKTCGWAPDSSKDLSTTNAFDAVHETKVSDGAGSGEQKNSPWDSANAIKMGQDSTWNSGSSSKAGSGWNDAVQEGGDRSNSGNGGGNSGW